MPPPIYAHRSCRRGQGKGSSKEARASLNNLGRRRAKMTLALSGAPWLHPTTGHHIAATSPQASPNATQSRRKRGQTRSWNTESGFEDPGTAKKSRAKLGDQWRTECMTLPRCLESSCNWVQELTHILSAHNLQAVDRRCATECHTAAARQQESQCWTHEAPPARNS